MTIYEKLAEARVQFQERGPKMSGKNSFAGYAYFELADILPVINKIGKDIGFICLVSFDADRATLTVKDTAGDGEIVFTSPMSTANLKGCHEVQNLGAVETYIKRYLYQNAFEIVEADAVNGTHNPNEKPAQKPIDHNAETLKAVMEAIRPNGTPWFTEAEKEAYRKKVKVYGITETLKQAEIALEEKQYTEE
jgi:hypothetical protein